MQIVEIRTLAGPNLHHPRPVLVMRLALGEDPAALRSDRIAGHVERLLALLPGLAEHRCSLRRPGGFVERLRRGTYPGHVVEHVALELSRLAGIAVGFGRALPDETGRSDRVRVVVRYRCEAGMRCLLEGAVALVDALQQGRDHPDLALLLRTARRTIDRHALGPSTAAVARAAEARGIPWQRIGASGNLLRLGWGSTIRWAQTAVTSSTSVIAAACAKDKELTKALLREAQVPVARGVVVADADAAARAPAALGRGPLVVKPLSGNHGRGCTLGVRDADALRAAYARAAAVDARVLIEQQVEGRDHRLLVVGGRLVAASLREPAGVVGDGTHGIAKLIALANRDPRRGSGHGKPLTRIAVDADLQAVLASQGLALDSVPPAGAPVRLRDTANLSTGGTATDVTERVHPDVAALAERAARALGLDVAGIDFMTPDIARADVGAVLEVNAGPGLRMHEHPSAGRPRDAGRAIVAALYPPALARPGRIPLVAVTGTNGKTTVTRMVAAVLAEAGRTVGMCCTDGVWIGGRRISQGDAAGPASARSVLADASVEAAVLETARGGIARRGLGWDWADVAIVTNVREDHIGQDGIRSHADLVRIKSLVAARVGRGGTLVLDADDPGAAGMAELPAVRTLLRGGGRKLVWTSLRGDALAVRRHLAQGHTALHVHDGWIVECRGAGARPERLVELARLPATLGGLADFMVANALAAFAAGRALGLDAATIARGLARLQAGDAGNRGRANLFKLRGGYALLDYGHNTDAYAAIGAFAARLPGYAVTGVVDMPGDRDDAVIRAGARAAGRAFDRVILHPSHDTRGRASGAVARMICAEIEASVPDCDCLIESSEESAAERALAELGPGRLAVLFYERYDVVRGVLARHGAEPACAVAPRLEREHERRWSWDRHFAGPERRAA